MRRMTNRILATVAAVIASAATVSAASTDWWVVDGVKGFLSGTGDGVAVEAPGVLKPVDRWRRQVEFEEPVVLAVDRLPGGDIVAVTGHPAKLYRISGSETELLADLPGEEGTAVFVDSQGSIWVTTVSPGVLLEWADGRLEERGRFGDGGFWDIAEFGGSIVVAAGTPGTLFRVGDRGLERWLEVPDAFIRCMTVRDDRLILGTSGKGLVLSVDRQGQVAMVLDSPFTEISDIAVAADGEVWATALVGEPPPKPQGKSNGKGSGDSSGKSSSVETLNLDLPKVNGKTATSELVRITPEGALLHVHKFSKQVTTALEVDGDGILVGTGYEGEVWRFVDQGGARLATLDAVQVTDFGPGGVLVTQGPAGLWVRDGEGRRPRRFRSAAKNFPRPVRFGRYRIFPWTEGMKIRFRTGASGGTDEVWLPWTEFEEGGEGIVDLRWGKVLQWELELPEGGEVDRVEVAWNEINLPPVIEKVDVEDPGVIYLASPPPSGPVIRQEHPTLDGIFTTLGEPPARSSKAAKGKKYWQVGYRTVAWTATDPNGDPLKFELEIERSDGVVLPVRDQVDGTQLAVDVTAIPDGRYRFRLEASDESANPGMGETVHAFSEWFIIDNTPPRLTIEGGEHTWTVVFRDASAPIRVQFSRDGAAWRDLRPVDGVMDGSDERFEFDRETGAHLVVVRAIDRHHNRTVADVREGE